MAICKKYIREIESESGVLIIDDTIEEKPHSRENDIVSWHYDHSKGVSVKGIKTSLPKMKLCVICLKLQLRIKSNLNAY